MKAARKHHPRVQTAIIMNQASCKSKTAWQTNKCPPLEVTAQRTASHLLKVFYGEETELTVCLQKSRAKL